MANVIFSGDASDTELSSVTNESSVVSPSSASTTPRPTPAITFDGQYGRKKSNSISTAILARKKVAFDYADTTTSSSSSSLRNSSDDDLPKKLVHAHFTTSVTPSPHGMTPNTMSPVVSNTSTNSYLRKHSLKKLPSYPYFASEKLAMSKSLDSQLCDGELSSGTSSTSLLPIFNKRPLTDTPIVSGMTSPRDDTSDEEKEGKRSISHLNLSELGATHLKSASISPLTSVDNVNTINERNFEPKENKNGDIHNYTIEADKNANSTEFKENPRGDQKHSERHPGKPQISIGHPSEDRSPTDDLEDGFSFEKIPSIERLKTLLLTKPPPSARKSYTLNIPGQTSSKTSPDGKIASVDVGSKLVIVMVGLPARGKSYITNKLTRYLNWLQHDCRVFNVGNTRRKDKKNAGPEAKPLPDTNTPTNEEETEVDQEAAHNADFFAPDNKASNALRDKWAMDTLEQLLDYVIEGPGSVGIFDATNSTKHRRLRVLRRIQQRSNGELKILFLESICNDPNIIESNIRLKLSGPDYRDMDPKVALNDFVGRLHNYEKAYETIDDLEEKIKDFQYVKMIDVGKKVVSYNIQGFLASQTIYFLLNFNLCERQIWITRHGESVDNLSGRIGGDSHLTKRGAKFAKTLARFMNSQRTDFRKQQLEAFSTRLELKYNSIFNDDDIANIDNIPTEPNFCVWTSMLCRAVETGQYFNDQLYSLKEMRMLNELGGGKLEGLTYDEIQRKYPKEFDSRIRDKLSYRYPGVGGESYLDVLTRLRPLITEVERTTAHVLIISHRVVLRILLAYFLNLDKSNIGELDVPLHTLYCLESKPYGTDYRMYEYDEGLDWFVQAQPDHQKNVKEVGVEFRERKYSVVPTTPPSRRKSVKKTDDLFSVRRSLGVGRIDERDDVAPIEGLSLSSRKLEDLNRLRKPKP